MASPYQQIGVPFQTTQNVQTGVSNPAVSVNNASLSAALANCTTVQGVGAANFAQSFNQGQGRVLLGAINTTVQGAGHAFAVGPAVVPLSTNEVSAIQGSGAPLAVSSAQVPLSPAITTCISAQLLQPQLAGAPAPCLGTYAQSAGASPYPSPLGIPPTPTPQPYNPLAIQSAAQTLQASWPTACKNGNVASITPIVHPGAEPRQDEDLVAVVVTVCDGMSHDQLFSSVPQLAGDGKRVAVYSANPSSLVHIAGELSGRRAQGERSRALHRNLRHLISDITSVMPDSVVFNWECCSGCSSEGFPNNEVVMDLVKLLLGRGHMVMFSDFSLKALIKTWNEDRLGPNPFVKVGEFDRCFKLGFDPAVLSVCPSAQLQKLGELASDGTAELHAMGGTIAFSVQWQKADCSAYSCQVLTVMTEMEGRAVSPLPGQGCEVGAHRGHAGHVLLSYPSGGKLLASAGHWMELSRFDVTETNLLQAAAQYGLAYTSQLQSSLGNCATAAQRQQTVQAFSSQMVQQSVPCSYSA